MYGQFNKIEKIKVSEKDLSQKAIIKFELYAFSAVLQTIIESCQNIWGKYFYRLYRDSFFFYYFFSVISCLN